MCWTKEQAAKFKLDELGCVDPKYFNVAVHFTDEDETKAFQSINCFISQTTMAEREEWVAAEKKDTSNVLYFRKLILAKGMQADFIK